MYKKVILFASLVCYPFTAYATTYYIDSTCSKNGDGTTTDCALSTNGPGAFNSLVYARNKSVGCDVSIYQGTSYSDGNQLAVNWNGTVSDKVVVNTYNKGYMGLAKPIIKNAISISSAYQEYYDIQVEKTGSNGIVYIYDTHDILLSGMILDGKSTTTTPAVNIDGNTIGYTYNITIKDSLVHDSLGILGGKWNENVIIQDNLLYNCHEYCIQMASTTASKYSSNFSIIDNTLYNLSGFSAGTPEEGIVVGWYSRDGRVERNRIKDFNNPATGGAGSVGIIFDANSDNVMAINNIITDCTNGILFLASDGAPYVYGPCTNHKAYNNTLVNSKIEFLSWNGTDATNTGHDLKNNLFYSTTAGQNLIFVSNTEGASPATFTSDYNLFFNSTEAASNKIGSTAYSITEWKSLGYDEHSLSQDPLLTSSYSLQSLSPAINTGVNLSGYFREDYDGYIRVGLWDIGAYEFHQGVRGIVNVILHNVEIN